MSESSNGAVKRSPILSPAVMDAAKPRNAPRAQQAVEAGLDMSENQFYKAVFNTSKSLSERKSEVSSLAVSSLDAAKDRATVRAYDALTEWLSGERTKLAQKIIELSNVDSTAEMQAILKDMNTDLISFEDKANPIMDIIESIHFLRTNNLIADAFRDFQRDEKAEAERLANIEALKLELAQIDGDISKNDQKRLESSTERSWFGLGGLKSSALIEKTRAEEKIQELKASKSEKQEKLNALQAPPKALSQEDDEIKRHKMRLKELLDMTRGENQARMIDLRDSAQKFINTSRDRTASLRGQFLKLSDQIMHTDDHNQSMLVVYGILNDGLKDASEKNAKLREEINIVVEDEHGVEAVTRNQKLRTLDTHAGAMSRAQVDTMATFGTLNEQAMRIYTMRGATEQQISTARLINTEGVAATANRLATVLTAVSGAALGEAAEAAKDTLNRMRDSTADIAGRESIRVAMGTAQLNQQLLDVFQELEQAREIQQASTDITRNAMSDMSKHLKDLETTARASAEALREGLAARTLTLEKGGAVMTQDVSTSGFPGV